MCSAQFEPCHHLGLQWQCAAGRTPAGLDQQLCDNAATTVMAANAAVSPATGSWTVQQGTATFGNATSPTTGVSGLSLGVNIIVVLHIRVAHELGPGVTSPYMTTRTHLR